MKDGMYSLASLFAADGAFGFLGCAPAGGILILRLVKYRLKGGGEERVGGNLELIEGRQFCIS
jgi:hypothetical protein